MNYCSPPGSSVHGIFQARIVKWVAISFSRGSSWPRDQNCVSCISCVGRQILYHHATWEAEEEAPIIKALHVFHTCAKFEILPSSNFLPGNFSPGSFRIRFFKINMSFIYLFYRNVIDLGFPGSTEIKNLPANTGDTCSIPGSGRLPREGNGYPLQYSLLGNSWTEKPGRLQFMGSQKGQTWLSN